MVSIDDLKEIVHWVFKEPIIGPLKSKIAEIHHLHNRHDVIFLCRGRSDLDKISQTIMHNGMSTAVIWSKSKPEADFQYGGRLGEFSDMLSQSHIAR